MSFSLSFVNKPCSDTFVMLENHFFSVPVVQQFAVSLIKQGQETQKGNQTNIYDKKFFEFHHIFSSSIFRNYKQQLQKFVEQELNQDPLFLENLKKLALEEAGIVDNLLELIDLVKIEMPEAAEDQRILHQKMIYLIRQTSIEINDFVKVNDRDTLKKQIQLFINRACHWMYTTPSLLVDMQAMLEKTSGKTLSDVSGQNPSIFIEKFFKDLKSHPDLRGARVITDKYNDIHYFGSLPFFLYEIGQTQVNYTSRITYDDPIMRKVEVVKEFKSYLCELKRIGQSHLYINLMKHSDPHPKKRSKPRIEEKELSLKIESLADDPEFQGVLMVASLDKNSDFYQQDFKSYHRIQGVDDGNPIEFNTVGIDTFKQELLNHIFQPAKKSFFKWPTQLNLEKWKKEKVEKILDELHLKYFSEKTNLNEDEKRIFIELSYTKLIQALYEELTPTYSNISCKHSRDRAPSTYGLLYLLTKLESKQEINKQEMTTLLTMLFAPGLLVNNRGMTTDRGISFITVFKFLMNHYQIQSIQ